MCVFDVGIIHRYQISWKSVRLEPSCSMRTDIRADREPDRRTDRHEEADSRFSQFCERAYKWFNTFSCEHYKITEDEMETSCNICGGNILARRIRKRPGREWGWTGCVWYRIGISGEFLWTRWWTLGVYKTRRIFLTGLEDQSRF